MLALRMWQLTALLTALLLSGSAIHADDQKKADKNVVTIKVDDMTCGGCAMKVKKFVAKVGGVEKVEPDATAHTVTVFPKANSKVSPKELWEAVEKAGYTPSLLEGAVGSFKEKPKS
ncbi:MAG: heavy-metal-associated domain-containing protein [Planctomycetia bacterium]|nr:heavy-metal-associated domain-containing protein [Planctomycetia bacterium]